MDDIAEIKTDVKAILADVGHIKIEVAKNTTSLEYHIKRTDLSEARIKSLEYWALGMLGSALLAAILKLIA